MQKFIVVLALCHSMLAHLVIRADEPSPTPSNQSGKNEEAAPKVISIWPDVAPGSEGWQQKEVEYRNELDHKAMVRNVTRPTLTVFAPDPARANGTAIVICPGGGFRFLSWDNEGTDIARWLCERGVTAFVLKYRLMDTGVTDAEFQKSLAELFRAIAERAKAGDAATAPPMPEDALGIPALAIADGRQAIKIVRERAAEWNINSDRIGILGFSAGGVVTMGVVMEHDEASRPNFAVPIYGGGTNGKNIAADAPPLFVLCASDDTIAAASSMRLYSEWKAANRPIELHLYEKGGHGFGMAQRGLPIDHWTDRLGDWLQSRGLLTPIEK